jgi:transposase
VIERPPRKKNAEPDRYEILGVDIEEALTLDEPHGGGTRRRTIRVPAPAVRVFSTRLWRKKIAGLEGTRAKEQKAAAKDIRAWQAEAHACRADAQRAALRHTTDHTDVTLNFTATLRRVEGPLQRGRGRPRKNPEPDLAHDHYRVDYAWLDAPQAQSEERLREATTFVLIRTRSKNSQIDNADLIDRYKGQYHNEHGFAWLKSGAANKRLNPIFLENPQRIEALCFVYLIGLTIWTSSSAPSEPTSSSTTPAYPTIATSPARALPPASSSSSSPKSRPCPIAEVMDPGRRSSSPSTMSAHLPAVPSERR